MNDLGLVKRALAEMETESSDFSLSRAWLLLLIGVAKLDVLSVERAELDNLVDFLVSVDGGHSEDYYQTWNDIVAHAKAGEL